jgi:hypothetical protein
MLYSYLLQVLKNKGSRWYRILVSGR